MAELNDSQDLQTFSMGVLHVLSAITPPTEMVETVIANFVEAIQSSTVHRKNSTLPALVLMPLHSPGAFGDMHYLHW